MNDAVNPLNVALNNSTSFKYKASLLGKATDADDNDRSLKNAGKGLQLKTAALLVFFLWLVKSLKNL